MHSPLAPAWLSLPDDTAGLNAKIFSSGVARNAGQVTIQGIGVTELVEQFGSPLWVIDENDFRARARNYVDAFNTAFEPLCGGVDVFYASKALLTVQIAKWVNEEGLRIDTASGGEMAIALRAGTAPAHIGLHGNNKSDEELHTAISRQIGRIVVDSLPELYRVETMAARLRQPANVMLRLTPGVDASTHQHIATAHEDQKFGLTMTPAPGAETSSAYQAVRFADEAAHLNLVGLHSHIGSQIFDSAGFETAATRMLEFIAVLAAEDIAIAELDIGGGYGIAYTEADHPVEPAVIARNLAAHMTTEIDRLGIRCPRISIEPGRSIAGPAGLTIYTVGTTKTVWVEHEGQHYPRRYVAVDGGMSDNPRPVLYDADYTAVLANRVSDADAVFSRVVGKHCESGDIVVNTVYLPEDTDHGDLLVVPATGAYGHVMSSNYNMLLRPAIVAIKDGQAREIIRRETYDDLFAREVDL
ncbi:MAG TPA: diaminopimelate decarboxylase [Enteractinococcus helveticum]|uniref:Diaminopimelate decarboxylase n=1 Tax=Enteractinococcus helveticum TaxID=1837282 RepID=A0A921FMD4_9MICC|nr:diaminopimelate decarboxylase [Enteractinococcus helveticum]HJF14485.1 diaminopimelate decarboxylase [Enteractinococcus helveticum]